MSDVADLINQLRDLAAREGICGQSDVRRITLLQAAESLEKGIKPKTVFDTEAQAALTKLDPELEVVVAISRYRGGAVMNHGVDGYGWCESLVSVALDHARRLKSITNPGRAL